jgi:hypothetical protein
MMIIVSKYTHCVIHFILSGNGSSSWSSGGRFGAAIQRGINGPTAIFFDIILLSIPAYSSIRKRRGRRVAIKRSVYLDEVKLD